MHSKLPVYVTSGIRAVVRLSKRNPQVQLDKLWVMRRTAHLHQLLGPLPPWEQEVKPILERCLLVSPAVLVRLDRGLSHTWLAALGAVAVAAVGVWGVFKMAMAVAEGTGRTLNSNNGGAAVPAATAGAGTASQGANGLLPMQPDVPAGPIYPPSPQHRKVAQ